MPLPCGILTTFHCDHWYLSLMLNQKLQALNWCMEPLDLCSSLLSAARRGSLFVPDGLGWRGAKQTGNLQQSVEASCTLEVSRAGNSPRNFNQELTMKSSKCAPVPVPSHGEASPGSGMSTSAPRRMGGIGACHRAGRLSTRLVRPRVSPAPQTHEITFFCHGPGLICL